MNFLSPATRTIALGLAAGASAYTFINFFSGRIFPEAVHSHNEILFISNSTQVEF